MNITANITVSPNKKSGVFSTTNTTVVNSSSSEVITITPPAGYLMKIVAVNILINFITGATSGSTGLGIGGLNIGRYTNIQMPYNQNLSMVGLLPNPSTPISGETLTPTTEAAFIAALTSAVFSNSNPLYISYTNTTNANTQTGQYRQYTVQYILEPETVF